MARGEPSQGLAVAAGRSAGPSQTCAADDTAERHRGRERPPPTKEMAQFCRGPAERFRRRRASADQLGRCQARQPVQDSQVKLAGFVEHVASVVESPAASVPLVLELAVGLPGTVPLERSGRNLDNYLYPLAQKLGPRP